MCWIRSYSNYGWQRDCIRLGCPPLKTSPNPSCFLPRLLPPEQVAELKRDHFYGGLPKCLKAMVAYLKARLQDRTYSDCLRAACKAEKEDSMDLSWSPQTQTTDNTPKTAATSFLPLQKLKGNQCAPKAPIVQWHTWKKKALEEMRMKGVKIPMELRGVTEEFMAHLVRAVKDTQTEEKHCYHCSSMEHFIDNCLLMKTLRENTQLNCKEGMASRKRAWSPQIKLTMPKNPQEEVPKA